MNSFLKTAIERKDCTVGMTSRTGLSSTDRHAPPPALPVCGGRNRLPLRRRPPASSVHAKHRAAGAGCSTLQPPAKPDAAMGDAALLAGAGVAAAAAPPAAAAVMGVFKYNFGELTERASGSAPLPALVDRALYWFVGAGISGSNARCAFCAMPAAQFLSRIIPFVFNIWFVRQLGADDGAVSVRIFSSFALFVLSPTVMGLLFMFPPEASAACALGGSA